MNILSLNKIKKAFDGSQIIDNLSLDLDKSKIYALIGSNGAGKTTLLNIINGQLLLDDGVIIFKNQNITKLSTFKRANLGLLRLWQDGNIFENLTVMENLIMVRKHKGENLLNYLWEYQTIKKFEKKNIEDAENVLKTLSLYDKKNSLGAELSFGQQRLLSFGQIMMNEELKKGGLLILIDEPFAGLHISAIQKLINTIQAFAKYGNTILMIEHNIEQVLRLSDEIFLMKDGNIEQRFNPQNTSNIDLHAIYNIF